MIRFPFFRRRACLLPLLSTTLAFASAQSQPRVHDAAAMIAELPVRIVPNVGQWDSPELYRMQVGGMQMFLERRGWSFWLQEAGPAAMTAGAAPRRGAWDDEVPAALRAVAVRMEFVGAGMPTVTTERPLVGVSNYLLGDEALQHRTGVPGYGSVLYESMYPGIDVRVREAAGHCEYDLLLAPGADLAQVRVRVTGAASVAIDAAGSLVLNTALGEVRQPLPVTWMVSPDGTKRPIVCTYALHGTDAFGFVAPDRDATLPLVVDPPILYSTYFGGSGTEEPMQVIEDGNGHILVCGRTTALNFPTSVGAVQPAYGGGARDGILLRLDPSQLPASQVVFATYFGGNANDTVFSVITLPSGLVAFAGASWSTNLPVSASAFQTAPAGAVDGFVGMLDAGGSVLLALTYFGGSSLDAATSIVAAPNGDLLVGGNTQSTTLPTTANAFSTTHSGGTFMNDGFIARFDPLVTTLLYGTYFGGSGDEWLFCWDVDAAGVLTTVSGTSSIDFPVTPGAFDTTHNGGGTTWETAEAAISRFDPSLPPAQQLVYSTFLGGGGDDWPWIARSTATGEIVVSGTTNSINFPTTASAYQTTFRGGVNPTNGFVGDGFLVKIDPSIAGSAALIFGTYFGGVGQDQGLDCAIDSTGEVTLVGWTGWSGNNLPTTPGAMRRTYAANDGYVARFSSDGRQLLYSSYVGGSGNDGAWFAARHADGVPTVCGQTYSTNLPTQNPAQLSYGGNGDAWVSRFQLIPTGTTRRGGPSLGTNGSPTIHALGDATIGNPQFGFACSRAPLNKIGLLVFALLPAPGVPLLGIDVWVDPLSIVLSATVTSNLQGESLFSLPYPAFALPTFHTQYVWIEDPFTLLLSASDAMQIH